MSQFIARLPTNEISNCMTLSLHIRLAACVFLFTGLTATAQVYQGKQLVHAEAIANVNAIVPGEPFFVAVRLIVFLAVGDEIVEAKPVMRGYVVHCLIRPIHITRTVWKQVIAPV